jgi:hypothetical protein
VGATAPRHFAVAMIALPENLHDPTVGPTGAEEQGATIVFAPLKPIQPKRIWELGGSAERTSFGMRESRCEHHTYETGLEKHPSRVP